MEKLKVTEILEQIMDLSSDNQEEVSLIESSVYMMENEEVRFETPIIESVDEFQVELSEEEVENMNISEETIQLINELKEEALELINQLGE